MSPHSHRDASRRSHILKRAAGCTIEPLEQRRLLTSIGIDAAGYGASTANTDNYYDISNAISAAAATPGGNVVYLQDGTDGAVYYISSPLQIPSDVTLRGESATNTIIDYIGTAAAIEPASSGGVFNAAIQNLTIVSGGKGIFGGSGFDQNGAAFVSLDVENVKFETVGTAIDLPGYQSDSDPGNDLTEIDGEGIQSSYLHNIDIDVSDFTGTAEAIDLGGNNNDIDGLTIEGSPGSGYSGPENDMAFGPPTPTEGYSGADGGLIDVHNGLATVLRNITITATFGTSPITDFYINNDNNAALQDIWINKASVSTIQYQIVDSDVTFDQDSTEVPPDNTDPSIPALGLALNADNRMDVEYIPYSQTNPPDIATAPIVIIDNLLLPSTDEVVGDAIKADDNSEVQVTKVTPISSSEPIEVDQPNLDGSGILIPTQGYDITSGTLPAGVSYSTSSDAAANTTYLQGLINGIEAIAPGTVIYFPSGVYYINTLTLPSSTDIEGTGLISSQIICESPESTTLGALELTGNPDSVTIRGVQVQNLSGYGITADCQNAEVEDISNLLVSQVNFDTSGYGINLPAGEAEVSTSTFSALDRNGRDSGLISVNVDGSSTADTTTIEECNDPQTSATATDTVIAVTNVADSLEHVSIFASAEEWDGAVFFNLSGPNIGFFGNYIADGTGQGTIADIILDDATNLQADSFGTY